MQAVKSFQIWEWRLGANFHGRPPEANQGRRGIFESQHHCRPSLEGNVGRESENAKMAQKFHHRRRSSNEYFEEEKITASGSSTGRGGQARPSPEAAHHEFNVSREWCKTSRLIPPTNGHVGVSATPYRPGNGK